VQYGEGGSHIGMEHGDWNPPVGEDKDVTTA
jgi:hypothetical protein